MDDYMVLERVGEGSFGKVSSAWQKVGLPQIVPQWIHHLLASHGLHQVYKARRKSSGKVVALKLIPKTGKSEK